MRERQRKAEETPQSGHQLPVSRISFLHDAPVTHVFCVTSYRYGTLIVFANYLIEMQEREGQATTFPDWLHEHREITTLLSRRTLD